MRILKICNSTWKKETLEITLKYTIIINVRMYLREFGFRKIYTQVYSKIIT